VRRWRGLTHTPQIFLWIFVALSCSSVLPVPACAQGSVSSSNGAFQIAQARLQPGQLVSQQIAAGTSHRYVVALEAGQFVRFGISTHDVATTATLFPPGEGRELVRLSFPGIEKMEPLCWVASTSGDYTLEISVLGQTSGIYRYEIKIDEVRLALPADENRTAAQQLFEQARGLTEIGDFAGASDHLEKALTLSRAVKDLDLETAYLAGTGAAYARLRQSDMAVRYYGKAVEVARGAKDRTREGESLRLLASAHSDLRQYERAMECYKQALQIARDQSDRKAEFDVLRNIGIVFMNMSQADKAAAFAEQSLAVARQMDDSYAEGRALGNLGNACVSLSQYEKAIGYYEKDMAIMREMKDRLRESWLLQGLGLSYTYLGQYGKAIDYYEQSLTIEREIKDRGSEAGTLTDLAVAYSEMDQYPKAIKYFEEALAIDRESKNRAWEPTPLYNLGWIYQNLGDYQKSLAYYEEAIPIAREVRDRMEEGRPIRGLGDVYRHFKQYEKAIQYYDEALMIFREIKDRLDEWRTLSGLMQAWEDKGNPRLAIFYGKQTVNTIQSVRADIGGLTGEVQKGFVKENENPYHALAALLVKQGRLAEAEQVLNLLKEEEYFDFVRRDSADAPSLGEKADLTADETEWEVRYRKIENDLVALGTERGELLAKEALTPAETQRMAELDQSLALGNARFEKFLDELAEHFSKDTEVAGKVERLLETQGIMADLRELPEGTVAIYTLVGRDKYVSILVTPDVQKAYEYPISAAELNRKVLEFRQVVEDPKLDPRPQASEMYKILVANLAGDLRQAKAKTIMWSLDGALRYLPIAALYDGTQYFAEQYALSVFTPASNARLKDRPTRDWTAAGFGVTKAHQGASALPDVRAELTSIIAEEPGKAILRGEVKLDDEFTENAMRRALLQHYPVVHIASHFRFQPGNETNSSLLLGDGTHLSLAELKTMPNLFGGVQLLTLSACNTGIGDAGGDGKEVEGLGVMAQRKGAKAVVASLWSVADISTSVFMQEFYRVRESSGTTKAEALRQAQLALLHGTATGSATARPVRQLMHEEPPRAGRSNAPPFDPDAKAPYAHPYYWAPFFLMGNWL
jgi:CHAT domain-containing protein/Tfp pilus assembly protein PilF